MENGSSFQSENLGTNLLIFHTFSPFLDNTMDIISHPLITYIIFEIGSRYKKKNSLFLDTLYERDESIKCVVHTEHG